MKPELIRYELKSMLDDLKPAHRARILQLGEALITHSDEFPYAFHCVGCSVATQKPAGITTEKWAATSRVCAICKLSRRTCSPSPKFCRICHSKFTRETWDQYQDEHHAAEFAVQLTRLKTLVSDLAPVQLDSDAEIGRQFAFWLDKRLEKPGALALWGAKSNPIRFLLSPPTPSTIRDMLNTWLDGAPIERLQESYGVPVTPATDFAWKITSCCPTCLRKKRTFAKTLGREKLRWIGSQQEIQEVRSKLRLLRKKVKRMEKAHK